MRFDDTLLDRIRSTLAQAAEAPTPARVAALLRAEGAVLGDAAVLEVTEALRAEITGAGPLDPLLRRPGVTDVLVNGPDEVWVDDGDGLRREPVRFRDESAVRRLAVRLASSTGRRLDDAVPYVDARLASGVRLHAVVPPIAPDGTVISLRVPSGRALSLADLVAAGTVPGALEPWLTALVRARLAFLITGRTGCGKTTVLEALLGVCDPGERIVLVEDAGELRPDHPHVVRLEARAANVEGAGRVGLDVLVRQALRMRPDRIVVGEVRGAEVVDLLAALNTGHEGGCGTLHANSTADVPARLEALGLAAGLGRAAVHAQARAALDAVIHLVRDDSGRRRVAQVDVMAGDGAGRTVRASGGGLATATAFRVDGDGAVSRGPGFDVLAELLARRGWEP
ncbi:TadA family conjugal transfer-associated ATPase [Jiangella aurantiaca]|uniref:TadA family conjugal transfer-associated ATPase n=1 Tax=Jiangella aurantiaca TaxID=2530373 RepID=A0A4R5AHQ4_9ACTN|nr:TadA family conjugal transfer-associated ATPase [Jiangella aurantiaca]TDD70474.1 TadA family conjugal transfer-associated ATPase [Jiangella aurantiaca]